MPVTMVLMIHHVPFKLPVYILDLLGKSQLFVLARRVLIFCTRPPGFLHSGSVEGADGFSVTSRRERRVVIRIPHLHYCFGRK